MMVYADAGMLSNRHRQAALIWSAGKACNCCPHRPPHAAAALCSALCMQPAAVSKEDCMALPQYEQTTFSSSFPKGEEYLIRQPNQAQHQTNQCLSQGLDTSNLFVTEPVCKPKSTYTKIRGYEGISVPSMNLPTRPSRHIFGHREGGQTIRYQSATTGSAIQCKAGQQSSGGSGKRKARARRPGSTLCNPRPTRA